MKGIIGARGDFSDVNKLLDKINNFSDKHNVVIQVFNADMIYGKDHLISAVFHAKRAMKRKTNTTNTLSMEILLYASGERQLKHAIPKMGIKEGNLSIAIVFTNDDVENKNIVEDKIIDLFLDEMSLSRDDSVLEGSMDTIKKFGIDEMLINTISKDKYGDLILEKIAMVDIIK